MEAVNARVRNAMKAQRWSTRALAAELKIARPTLIRALKGLAVKGYIAEKIAVALFDEATRPGIIAGLAAASPPPTQTVNGGEAHDRQ